MKVYCIIKDEKYLYIPIKAKLDPHKPTQDPHEPTLAYLAEYPNFFGGNPKDDETDTQALIREVEEESQRNITFDKITESTMTKLYKNEKNSTFFILLTPKPLW